MAVTLQCQANYPQCFKTAVDLFNTFCCNQLDLRFTCPSFILVGKDRLKELFLYAIVCFLLQASCT